MPRAALVVGGSLVLRSQSRTGARADVRPWGMDIEREHQDNPTANDGTADAQGVDPSENGHAPTEEDGTPVENPSG